MERRKNENCIFHLVWSTLKEVNVAYDTTNPFQPLECWRINIHNSDELPSSYDFQLFQGLRSLFNVFHYSRITADRRWFEKLVSCKAQLSWWWKKFDILQKIHEEKLRTRMLELWDLRSLQVRSILCYSWVQIVSHFEVMSRVWLFLEVPTQTFAESTIKMLQKCRTKVAIISRKQIASVEILVNN